MKGKIVSALLFTLVLSLVIVPTLAMERTVPDPEIEEIIFVHYVAPPIKNPAKEATDDDPSYRLLHGGVKWTTLPVEYDINPDGCGDLDGDGDEDPDDHALAEGDVKASFETWDAEVLVVNIFDEPGTTTLSGIIDDLKNTVSWILLDEGIIAVARIRYYVNTKEVFEFDIAFNTYYDWTTDGVSEPSKMDIQNIGTHEAGHTLVLLDLYVWKTAELTMYGYSEAGETKKIDLGTGDELGITKLYG